MRRRFSRPAVQMARAAHLAAGIGGFDYVDLDAPFFVDTSVTDRSWVSSDGVYDLSGVEKGIGVIPIGTH